MCSRGATRAAKQTGILGDCCARLERKSRAHRSELLPAGPGRASGGHGWLGCGLGHLSTRADRTGIVDRGRLEGVNGERERYFL
jgi:hypothetical protein